MLIHAYIHEPSVLAHQPASCGLHTHTHTHTHFVRDVGTTMSTASLSHQYCAHWFSVSFARVYMVCMRAGMGNWIHSGWVLTYRRTHICTYVCDMCTHCMSCVYICTRCWSCDWLQTTKKCCERAQSSVLPHKATYSDSKKKLAVSAHVCVVCVCMCVCMCMCKCK